MGSCRGLSIHEVVTVYFLRYHYWLLNITWDSKIFWGSQPPPPPQLFTTGSGRTGLKPAASSADLHAKNSTHSSAVILPQQYAIVLPLHPPPPPPFNFCPPTRKCHTVLPRLSVPQLSETSVIRTQFGTWSLFKKMVFALKSQTRRLRGVHVFLCHTYMFNVGTQWYVIVYSVKCKGLQARPSYIFLCYNSMCIARKASFGLSEQFRLSEQPIKPLCPKVFG